MKVVIAIDSFKGSLTSLEAGNSAAAGVRRVFPDAECIVRPLADGGEGTVDALVAACEGKKIEISVTGPLGEPVLCQYGLIEKQRLPSSKCPVPPESRWYRLPNAILSLPQPMAWAKSSGTPSKKAAATSSSALAEAPPMTAAPVCSRLSVFPCSTKTERLSDPVPWA